MNTTRRQMTAMATAVLAGGDPTELARAVVAHLVPEDHGALMARSDLYRASIRARADRILGGDLTPADGEMTAGETLACDVQSEAAWGGRW